jgi:hypothetical protein
MLWFQAFILPPAPSRTRQEAAPAVSIPSQSLKEFEELAGGSFFAFAEREQLLARLPRIDSALARIPLADAEMPDREGSIPIRQQELRGLHEILLTTLNVSEVRLIFDSRRLLFSVYQISM